LNKIGEFSTDVGPLGKVAPERRKRSLDIRVDISNSVEWETNVGKKGVAGLKRVGQAV